MSSSISWITNTFTPYYWSRANVLHIDPNHAQNIITTNEVHDNQIAWYHGRWVVHMTLQLTFLSIQTQLFYVKFLRVS